MKLASQMGFRFPQFVATKLDILIPQSGPDGIYVMNNLLTWDPSKRLSASKCLQHPYFEAGAIQESKAPPESNPNLPKIPGSSSGTRSAALGAMERVAALEQKAKAAAPPPVAPSSLAGDMLSTTKSWRDGSSHPGTGKKIASAGKENGGLVNLPPLQQERKGSGAGPSGGAGKSPGQRYLKMARYQPGVQATPAGAALPPLRPALGAMNHLPSAACALGNAQGMGNGRRPSDPSRPNYFGAHAARMFG